ncbi:radical SAM family heme chaperone HemW [uncultured Helcococcus sp.]|uniref:radical SAM family heme chaperone HemW n=1 Tax=uncultured Helcococcus sp. TaxID=1072508 RepID=UPI00288BBDE6|nr:radical SAM family heme chaperone HemW [uncultured Helcococcus sp.]
MINTENKPIGLYIHIPFCEKKCNYCNFLTFVNNDEQIEKYVQYLIKEINLYKGENIHLDTIYIGGGTPSYLDEKYMVQIVDAIKNVFVLEDNIEFTIEMNPESVEVDKIKTYLQIGINRFSMGVQSFNNDVLNIMGRLHNRTSVFKKLALMRELGCKNISIDLMLANPKQDIEILRQDLAIACKLDIDHISYYSLILKEQTYFDLWYRQGKIDLFDPEEERKMYHEVVDTLVRNGFDHYEISSFAKNGLRGIHNAKYWTLNDFIGLGMGAAGNISRTRFENVRDFDSYYDLLDKGQKPLLEIEELSIEDREKEYLMLNLRMMQGFDIDQMNKKFSIDFEEKYKDILEKNIGVGILKKEENRIKFTDYGIDNGEVFFHELYGLN